MADFTLPQAKKPAGLTPTDIEWTDFAFNPLRAVRADGKAGWACVKVAPGCAHCYAESLNKRWGTGQPFTAKGMEGVRVVLDEQRLAAALAAKPRGPFRSPDGRPKVFVCDMTDLFGEWVPFDVIDRIFALFALRPDIDWQVLTKRPERMAEYLPTLTPSRLWDLMHDEVGENWPHGVSLDNPSLPLRNVWLGTSASTQADLDRNVPHLLRCEAAVRFLSLEPLVERVELDDTWLHASPSAAFLSGRIARDAPEWTRIGAASIDWVIVGGESGAKARPCYEGWTRRVIRQCTDAHVPVFHKQRGSRPTVECRRCEGMGHLQNDAVCPDCDGQEMVPEDLRDPKGGDPSEWPEDLRVRQWPEVRRG